MNGRGCLGVACGFLALVAVFGFGICALLGAAATWGTAVGVGHAIETGTARVPVFGLGTDYGLHVVGMTDIRTFVEDLVEQAVEDSGFCDRALEQVRQRPLALAALGEPLGEATVLAVRTFSIDPVTGGKANLTLEVRGSLGTGKLEVVAHRGPGALRLGRIATFEFGDGEWDFDRLDLRMQDSQEHIDLLLLDR
jgi:hypothetical protein